MAMLQYASMPRMPRERYAQPPMPPLDSGADQGLVLALLQMLMRQQEEGRRNRIDEGQLAVQRSLAESQTTDAADTRKRVAMMEAGQRSENYINREVERVRNQFSSRSKELDEGIEAGMRTGAQSASRFTSPVMRAARSGDLTTLRTLLGPSFADDVAKGLNSLEGDDAKVGFADTVRRAVESAGQVDDAQVQQNVRAVQQMIPAVWETFGVSPSDWKAQSRAAQAQKLEMQLAPRRGAVLDEASRLYGEGVDPSMIPDRVRRFASQQFGLPDFDVSGVRGVLPKPLLPTEANPTPTFPATNRAEDVSRTAGSAVRGLKEFFTGSPVRSQFEQSPGLMDALSELLGTVTDSASGVPSGFRTYENTPLAPGWNETGPNGTIYGPPFRPQPTPLAQPAPKPQPTILEAVETPPPNAAPMDLMQMLGLMPQDAIDPEYYFSEDTPRY